MNLSRSMIFILSGLCCALVTEAGGADPQAKPVVRPIPYGFLGHNDGPPLAMVFRGHLTWLGDFDNDGNFIRHPGCSANLGANGGSLLPRFVMCGGYQHFVYEHRSGRLIKGTMVIGPREVGKFFCIVVPEIGSTILDVKDVDLKNPDPDRQVWNMPELVPKYDAARKRKYGDKPVPAPPDPPKAGTPAGWEFTPFSQLGTNLLGFKAPPGKQIKHARAIGDVVEFGHLSDEGEFIPDPDLPVVSRSGIIGPMKFDFYSEPRYYTVPAQAVPGRERQEKDGPEEVYEYRSGRLIKGKLHLTGNFVPELGSKIIDFKDYDPSPPRQRRIYNLPGVLRRVEEK
jgi:hypothetical protein